MLSNPPRRFTKKNILGQRHTAWFLAAPGMTEECRQELETIQKSSFLLEKENFVLEIEGTRVLLTNIKFRALVELVFRCQTAKEVYWQLHHERVGSVGDLIKALFKVDWTLFLPHGQPVSLRVDSLESRLYHEGMVKETAERFFREKGIAVSADALSTIFLELNHNHLTVYLSLHGDGLERRGYRDSVGTTAPIPEHLANSLIRAAASFAKEHGVETMPKRLYVPFCGGGTFLFECWMRQAGLGASVWREKLAIENVPCFPEDTGRFIRKKILEQGISGEPMESLLLDIHERAIAETRDNARRFFRFKPDLESHATIKAGDFFQEPGPFSGHDLFVPLNPPYGIRLSIGDVPVFFERIAERLNDLRERQGATVVGFCLIPTEVAWRRFSQKLSGFTQKTRHITHGGLDLRVTFFVGSSGL